MLRRYLTKFYYRRVIGSALPEVSKLLGEKFNKIIASESAVVFLTKEALVVGFSKRNYAWFLNKPDGASKLNEGSLVCKKELTEQSFKDLRNILDYIVSLVSLYNICKK